MFKTIVDPYVGRVNLFKVLQGTVKTDATLVNGRTMADERLHQLIDDAGQGAGAGRPRCPPGDIAAVAKLADTTTGDVLGARGAEIDVEPFEPPEPVLAVAIRAEVEGRRGQARQRAAPPRSTRTRRCGSSATRETHQTLLWGMGETHLVDRARAAARASSASRSRPRT